MVVDWQRILPVLISIAVIVGVAILRQYSRTLTAITATMPLNIVLTIWIVVSGEGGTHESKIGITNALLIGVVPTICFLLVAILAARADWSVAGIIGAGYAAWAVVLVMGLLLQRALGLGG